MWNFSFNSHHKARQDFWLSFSSKAEDWCIFSWIFGKIVHCIILCHKSNSGRFWVDLHTVLMWENIETWDIMSTKSLSFEILYWSRKNDKYKSIPRYIKAFHNIAIISAKLPSSLHTMTHSVIFFPSKNQFFSHQ